MNHLSCAVLALALVVVGIPSGRAFAPAPARPPSTSLSAVAPFFATLENPTAVTKTPRERSAREVAEVAALRKQIAALEAEAAAFERQAEALEEEAVRTAAAEAARVRAALGAALEEASEAKAAAAVALGGKANAAPDVANKVMAAPPAEEGTASSAAGGRRRTAQIVRDGIRNRAMRRMSLRERLRQIEAREEGAAAESAWRPPSTTAGPSPSALVKGDVLPSRRPEVRGESRTKTATKPTSLREIAILASR